MLALKSTRLNGSGAFAPDNHWQPDAAWVFANGVDSVSLRPSIYRPEGSTPIITQHGPGIKIGLFANAHILQCADNVDNIGSGDFTVVSSFVLNAKAGYVVLGRYLSNSNASSSDWFIGGDELGTNVLFIVCCGANRYEAKVTSPIEVGELNTLIGRRVGTTIDVQLYSQGSLVGQASLTNAGITTVNYTLARKLKLGELDLGPQFNAQISGLSGAIFKRGLSNSQCADIGRNQWLIFR